MMVYCEICEEFRISITNSGYKATKEGDCINGYNN